MWTVIFIGVLMYAVWGCIAYQTRQQRGNPKGLCVMCREPVVTGEGKFCSERCSDEHFEDTVM